MHLKTHLHLVVRARFPHTPFNETLRAQRAWSQLRRQFPEALAAVLMPNHLHLLTPREAVGAANFKLGRVLSATGPGIAWEPLHADPSMPSDEAHLQRIFRYILLNPCRSRFVPDPGAWVWSTFRDVFGAAAGRPWTSAEKIQRAFRAEGVQAARSSPGAFQKWLHEYLCNDRDVAPWVARAAVVAVEVQVPAPDAVRCEPLEHLVRAFAAAHRLTAEQAMRDRTLRPAFFAFLRRRGWGRSGERHAVMIARATAMHEVTVRRYLRACDGRPERPDEVSATDVCILNPRFYLDTYPKLELL